MAKLIAVLMLVGKTIPLDDDKLQLQAGEVVELEPKLAKALVKAGDADDTPANIAFHRGDIALYEQLLAGASASKAQAPVPIPVAGNDLLAGGGVTLSDDQKLAQDAADQLLAAADAEQDPAVADDLRGKADEILVAAGLKE